VDPDQTEHLELTFLLGIAFQLVVSEFVSRLDAAGHADLRPVHGMAFQVLGSAGGTATELAERLGVTKQAAGQIIDDLEQRGYVRRERHPDGGRRRLVVLTDTARGHLADSGRILHALEAELATTTDMRALRTQLTHLIRQLAGDNVPPLRPVW
jgi:DNA-binding MarR family transcriptional regulator